MTRWLEVADRVLARRYDELDLTVGLVIGDGECLVIDTRGDAEQGAELAAAVRSVTAAPWRIAITHAHFDHCFGTAAFLPSQVWAHPRCIADLRATAESQRAHWMAHYRSTGQPGVADALAVTTIVLPDQPVDGLAELDVGGRRVVLAHPGLGHTDHDLVVWLPEDGVLFAGDLVEHGAPPAFEDSFPLDWPGTLDALLDLGPRVVVPGHGEPVGVDFVQAQRDELRIIASLCGRVSAGESVEALLAESPYPADVTRIALARCTGTSNSPT